MIRKDRVPSIRYSQQSESGNTDSDVVAILIEDRLTNIDMINDLFEDFDDPDKLPSLNVPANDNR